MATAIARKNPRLIQDDYLELVMRFPLVPIRSDAHLKKAHNMIDELIRIPEKKLTASQSAYLEVLGDLTSKYEQSLLDSELHHASGLEMLQYLMENSGTTQAALATILGISESAVSLILSGKREITAKHARKLGERFKVGPGLFL